MRGEDEYGTGWDDDDEAGYGGEWEEAGEDEAGQDAAGRDAAGQDAAGQDVAGRDAAGEATAAPAASPRGGPWDVDDDVPVADRIDFGSLRVPVGEGAEVQIGMAENQAAWITVVRGASGLQVQAFAAPKSGGLWDDVRDEIAADVAKAGGQCQEVDGPFGIELRARIAPPDAAHGGGRHAGRGLQPVRFLGVDGPRWFLRGVITGPAAQRDELARLLERVFGEIVVVRGDHPVPPRDLLEIQLPEEARQALGAEQAEPEEQEGSRWAIGPFERGPEITETR